MCVFETYRAPKKNPKPKHDCTRDLTDYLSVRGSNLQREALTSPEYSQPYLCARSWELLLSGGLPATFSHSSWQQRATLRLPEQNQCAGTCGAVFWFARQAAATLRGSQHHPRGPRRLGIPRGLGESGSRRTEVLI